jgi:hypothetical protein
MANRSDDASAERALKSVASQALEASAIDDIRITRAEDHTGEPAWFVDIRLRSGRKRPTSSKSLDLTKAMQNALLDMGDDRFPYLSFSAPEDEQAEDTRKFA